MDPIVQFWQPTLGDPLCVAVERIFYWDGLPDQPRERVFPNGRANLMLQLDDPYRPALGAVRDPFPALCIDRLWTTPNVIEAPARRTRVIGIALTPIGAVKILYDNLGALPGVTHLEDVVGDAARELGERASDARDARSAIMVAAGWLRERLLHSREIPGEVSWLAQEIDVKHGALAVRPLPSRLSGLFRTYFGLTPKRYARIVRARRATELLCDGVSLAETALIAGYYDQAHFASEFKSHAGMTPSDFLRASRYSGSTSLAEGRWDDFSKTAMDFER